MDVRPYGTGGMLFVEAMMQETERGLKEEECEDNNSNNRMRLVQL